MTLDFRVLVRANTPEVCRESFFSNNVAAVDGEPDLAEHVER